MIPASIRPVLSDSQLLDLGHAVANFALLDRLLRILLATLAGSSIDLGMAISKDLPFLSLLESLTIAHQDRFPEPARTQAFVTLLRRARRVADRRDQMIQSLWGVTVDESVALRLNELCDESRSPQRPSLLDSNELGRFAEEIGGLAHDVQAELLGILEHRKA